MYRQNARLSVKSVYLISKAKKLSNLKLNRHLLLGISDKYYLKASVTFPELGVYFLILVVNL